MCKHDDEFRENLPRYRVLLSKFISSLAELNVLGTKNGLQVKAMRLNTALEPDELLEVIDQCPNVRRLDTTLWSESQDTDSGEVEEGMERDDWGEFQPSPSDGCAAWHRNCMDAREWMCSKFVKHDAVRQQVPTSGANVSMTHLDLNLMAVLAAIERTETQWRELLESAGLRIVMIRNAMMRRRRV